MQVLTKKELKKVIGGLDFSSGIINAFVRAFDIIFEIGQSLGTAIVRIETNNLCKIETE